MLNRVLRNWTKPQRLIPLVTILSGGIAIIFSVFGIIETSITEAVIIALLTLIAVDSVSERISILEKIYARLEALTEADKRINADHLQLDNYAVHAKEICILAISGLRVIPQYYSFFASKIESGCTLRIVLSDPDSNAVKMHRRVEGESTDIPSNIRSALKQFYQLAKLQSINGGACEIKILDLVLPYSMTVIDINNPRGKLWVAYHPYKEHYSQRPTIIFDAEADKNWFNFYKKQFEHAWNEAIPLSEYQQLMTWLNE